MKNKVIILLVVLSMIGAVAGCGSSTKTMKGCIAYFNTEIKKALDTSGVSYTFEVKQSDHKNSDYHFVDCDIQLNGNLTNKQIFDVLYSIESIKRPDKAIPTYRYWVNADRCSITYNYCLLYGGEYVYSPISEKKYSDLHTKEKKCICDWIQGQYDKYDAIEGKYSGDKYSDSIFQDAEELFGLSHDELSVIWMKQYDYK